MLEILQIGQCSGILKFLRKYWREMSVQEVMGVEMGIWLGNSGQKTKY